MARQRRGGFKPPELKGTLGTLLRTAAQQAGAVRDVLERGAREGRSRFDEALAGRRRNDALAELGAIVLELIRQGEIDLGELPEVREVIARLDGLDAGHIEEVEQQDAGGRRKRFDDRGGRTLDEDDGTVSAAGEPTWAPPNKRAKSQTTVWKPGDRKPGAAAAAGAAAGKKGGITFEDEDLAEYMHPDDVPAKPKDPKGDS
jgi:hypothetical protein